MSCNYYTVSQKTRDQVFEDTLNYSCPFTKIFGILTAKAISHRQVKRLVEEPGNYCFCEIEKTSFEISKFLQRKTPVVNDGFVRNLLYSICVNNKMQLLSQNFQI